jgi:hypothetical protein
MRTHIIAPAALAIALAGSSAEAQVNHVPPRNSGNGGINLRLPEPGLPVRPVPAIPPGHNMFGPARDPVIVNNRVFQFRPGVGFVPLNGSGGGFQRRDQFVGDTGDGNSQFRFLPQAVNGAANGFNNGAFGAGAVGTPAVGAQLNPVTPQAALTPQAIVDAANNGTINTPAGPVPVNTGAGFVNGFNNGFNNGTGFVPGFGFTGFVPGFGLGGVVPLTPQPMIGGAVNNNPGFGPGGPVLGVNVPVTPIVGRPWNARNTRFVGIRDPEDRMVQARRTGEPIEAVAGSREERRAERSAPLEVRVAASDPDQLRMAQRVENIMGNRPLREGRVTAIGATGVVVHYDLNGTMKTERFSPDQAFFFDENGRLATIASSPGSVSIGDRVMIPTEGRQIRQSVAGSRQETVIRVSPRSSSRSTAIRSGVAGSRQSVRSRRYAR